MDKKSTLEEIFSNDPFGLLNVKPVSSQARNEDERLYASFTEINDFYSKNNREPQQGGGIQEHQLYSRLKSIRENLLKLELLKGYDTHGLLKYEQKEINSLDDIFGDDVLGLLNDESEGLFDLKHVNKPDERANAEFVARRKPCKDFTKYESVFKEVQLNLKEGKRKLVQFKQGNLRENTFYVHNGLLFLLEHINITQKEQYLKDGKRLREDGRTRCIFENGTESNMLKRSVEKILYVNGKVVSENEDDLNEEFQEKFNIVAEEDLESGYIYVLKSKSTKSEIREIHNLYKIGFSKTTVEERIKNAVNDPTFLMADVRIVISYKCYNMNPQKFEKLLHNFFGHCCINVDVFDNQGKRFIPREWFIIPLNIIEEAVHLIISGEVVSKKYNIDVERIEDR